MNKKQRDILYRMHRLLTAVPLPITSGGTQSASMTGFVSFGQDMAEFRPNLDKAWGYFNFQEYEEADILLSAIEAWIEMRKEQRWECQSSLLKKDIKWFQRQVESQRSRDDRE